MRDVDAAAGPEVVLDAVEDHRRLTAHDEPVLGALGVELVAQSLTGRDDDPLDLVVKGRVIQHQCNYPTAVRSTHGPCRQSFLWSSHLLRG